MLELDLHKHFDNFHIQLQCSISHPFTAIFGASGAGKTTLLNMIAGLTNPNRGKIILETKILFDSDRGISIRPQHRRIGYIFQESRLFPHMSIRENILYGLKNLPKSEQRFQEKDVVETLGIGMLLDRTPKGLSGGERQRCALARALLASPSLLLMDEPMAALDRRTKLQFLHFLKQVQHDYALPILYVSHDVDNVLSFADDVLVMESGTRVAQGKPINVLSQTIRSRFPKSTDSTNYISAHIVEHRIEDGQSVVQSNGVSVCIPLIDKPVQSHVTLSLHTSEIMVSLHRPKQISARNVLEGIVQKITLRETRVLLTVDVGFSMSVDIARAALVDLNLQTGTTVFLIF
ncbi:MAG: molybdenum ABC transporter ATP-binding protein [Myxococcota bacterium]|nr:molybdenum ABC transporter ATP-binding protein [Myxococcota bacterium]